QQRLRVSAHFRSDSHEQRCRSSGNTARARKTHAPTEVVMRSYDRPWRDAFREWVLRRGGFSEGGFVPPSEEGGPPPVEGSPTPARPSPTTTSVIQAANQTSVWELSDAFRNVARAARPFPAREDPYEWVTRA